MTLSDLLMRGFMRFPNSIEKLIETAEQKLEPYFSKLNKVAYANQKKVLEAFRKAEISTRHFTPTEGYGYDDIGRDSLDKLFSHIFNTEDALIRPQIANGTHAIFLALSGLLEPGDTVLSVSGKPYDTLQTAVGADKTIYNSLSRFGIQLETIDLIQEKTDYCGFDLEKIINKLHEDHTVKLMYVQRSRGYEWRNAISILQMQDLFQKIKDKFPHLIIVVDNCYGAFTETCEPTDVGADVICGSMIKNVGGGIAPTGGYICGKSTLIERIAARMTVPGEGREIGSYAASYRPYYQGIFIAPHTVLQNLKTASLFAEVMANLGYAVMPSSCANRSDTVESIRFSNEEELIAFCRAIQRTSPIESNVIPEPWEMPGYQDRVIMAAGTFVQGATSELSADAPLRKPYTAYIQGSLTYEHGKIALSEVIESL